jgi:hypothetical protein
LLAAALDADGRFVPTLRATDFQVSDGPTSITPVDAGVGVHEAISIVLVVDNSRSWIKGGVPWVDARLAYHNALTQFLDRIAALDSRSQIRLSTLMVDTPVTLGSGSEDAPSSDISASRGRVARLRVVDADLPLRDRIVDAIRLLDSEPLGRRRVLVVLSDGNDVRSPITYGQVLGDAIQAKVQVFGAGVMSQQAAQLRTLAAQTRGVFRDTASTHELVSIAAELAEAVCDSYLVEYIPPLWPGTHTVQLGIVGRTSAAAGFGYDSSARAPQPTLRVTNSDGLAGMLWPSVTLEVDPGSQRPVRSVEYLLDGHAVARGTPGEGTAVQLGVAGLFGGSHFLSVRVDDGLTGDAPAIEWAPVVPFAGPIVATGVFIVMLASITLVTVRVLRVRPAAQLSSESAETGFFLEPEVSTERSRTQASKPIPVRARGTLGRGGGSYGIDPLDPYFASVSRQHVLLEVRDGKVFAKPCSSKTVGRCVVEVCDTYTGDRAQLTGGRFTELVPGVTLVLGAKPAPSFGQRPAFTLRGGAMTAVLEPVAAPVG